MNEPSYCLDVFLGHDEHYRHELLGFLCDAAADFGITTVQRGRMGDVKSLRILTPKAQALYAHIVAGIRTGDDNDCEIHDNEVDARRSMRFMPDYNNPLGDEAFELKDWKSPVGGQPLDHMLGVLPRGAPTAYTEPDFEDSIY